MASTYSQNLVIELVATGEQQTTWGITTNNNFVNVFEDAIVGTAPVSFNANANLTLTVTQSVVQQTFRYLYLNVTSTIPLTAQWSLIVPTIYKTYVVVNNTTGGQSILVKTASGTGIVIPNGATVPLYVNNINVVQAFDTLPSLNVSTASISNDNIVLPSSVGGTTGSALNSSIIYDTGTNKWRAGPPSVVAGVSQILAGPGITLNPAGGVGTVTISAAAATTNASLSFGSGLLPSGGSYNGTTPMTLSVDTTNLVTLMGAQTLSNKTLVQPSITSIVNGNNILTFPAVTGTILTTATGVTQILAGSGITVVPAAGTGVVTISATGGGGGGGGSGTVTSVTVASPLSTALTFANPTTTPALTIQNASSPTTQFLRGDGTWATPAGSGTGSVTSVALTAPAEFAVSGSPVTASGTLAITKATQLPNLVWAGPSTGSTAAAPTFRSLVAADHGTGTASTTTYLRGDLTWQPAVSSIAMTVPSEFSITGTPITTAGTFALGKSNQSANTVWAGPTTGAAAAPTFRSLVAADLPSTFNIVYYDSSNPTFTSTGFTTTNAGVAGATSFTTAGTIANGTRITFQNTYTNGQIYTVTGQITNTVSFTPALLAIDAFSAGTTIYSVSGVLTQQQISDIVLGSNLTGAYANRQLTINATGGSGGVTQISAGTNITISSTGMTPGTGIVTINASGGGGASNTFNFGTYANPVDFTLNFGTY